MSQIEAAVAEYSRTILDLQLRLANAAGQICALNEQIEAKSKEIEELKKPKDAPKLEAVKDSA